MKLGNVDFIEEHCSGIKSYEGTEYGVKINEDNIEITNKNTNQVTNIDLNKIIDNLSWEEKFKYKQLIKRLPAEVIIDMFNEARLSSSFRRLMGGYFDHLNDRIHLNEMDFNPSVITHELGHAMDNTRTGNLSWGQYSFKENKVYKETFEKEFDEYIAKGGKTYKEAHDMSFYCTQNILEMFAECYTLLMLGDCNSKDCILKYFPKTLENVKQHIEYIRSLPQEVRHKK